MFFFSCNCVADTVRTTARRLRQAVFAAIAGDRDALALWRKGVSWATAGESLTVACLIAVGGRGAMTVAGLAKRLGLIKKFG